MSKRIVVFTLFGVAILLLGCRNASGQYANPFQGKRISQMKAALSNTYWNGQSGYFADFANAIATMKLLTNAIKSGDDSSKDSENWQYIGTMLITMNMFISNNSMSFYTEDPYTKQRSIFATSKSCVFTEEGVKAVFDFFNDEEWAHIVYVQYVNDAKILVVIEDGFGYTLNERQYPFTRQI